MARLTLVALAFLSACATQQAPPTAGAPTEAGSASVGDAVIEQEDDGGMPTEAKVAIGVGLGGLAAFVIYSAIVAVGSAAILASG